MTDYCQDIDETSVLVVGATGNQGGAVAHHLLSTPAFDVRALTRRPNSDAARALAARGVTLERGDLGEKETLRDAVSGVDAVFCVTDYFSTGTEEGEIEHGTNMAEVAAETDVEHFVYSSAMDADRDTGVPHFDSKFAVERRIEELGLPATVLRPAPYFQSFEEQRHLINAGFLTLATDRGVALPMLDVADVGAAAKYALCHPDETVGEAYDLFGGCYTLADAGEVFSSVTGRTVTPMSVPPSMLGLAMGSEIAEMFEWFNEYDARREATPPAIDVELTTLREYAEARPWTGSRALSAVAAITSPLR